MIQNNSTLLNRKPSLAYLQLFDSLSTFADDQAHLGTRHHDLHHGVTFIHIRFKRCLTFSDDLVDQMFHPTGMKI